tara:strand:+ start:1689 stop:1844 length:156 start_codon:yes stop_codon:yes gene_type:complete
MMPRGVVGVVQNARVTGEIMPLKVFACFTQLAILVVVAYFERVIGLPISAP